MVTGDRIKDKLNSSSKLCSGKQRLESYYRGRNHFKGIKLAD